MKNTCNVVRDLMPLYVDDMLSEESKQLVEEHIEQCEACKEEYRTMSAEV
ncbi:MAG: zf-HC2 domain-containing protein, partial [Lachnospiraceae bacterium]|nr:zf-HC2 domain-containing protein [Lachnospiraceae bacterium]